jgi:hypothetical protein
MADPVPPLASDTPPPPSAYCLCVKVRGRWKRAVTVTGSDQLEAFDRARSQLPEALRDKPVMFRVSTLCPADDAAQEQ